MSGPARQDATAPPVMDGPAELERLGEIRAQHPDVLVSGGGGGFGTWQAIITPRKTGRP